MVAAQRTRDFGSGAQLTIPRDNDKLPVVALREIADATVSIEGLKESLIKGHQKVVETEESEDDLIEFMEGEKGWLQTSGSESELGEGGMSVNEGSDLVLPEEEDDADDEAEDMVEDELGEDGQGDIAYPDDQFGEGDEE
jgi:DNA-directed RNA polymerase subunit omega